MGKNLRLATEPYERAANILMVEEPADFGGLNNSFDQEVICHQKTQYKVDNADKHKHDPVRPVLHDLVLNK